MQYSHSLLASNIFEAEKILFDLQAGGLKWLHLDFIDYKYTKGFGLTKPIVRYIKQKFPDLILEAHLMVKKPIDLIQDLIKEGIKWISFPTTEISIDEFKKIKLANTNINFGIAILANEKIKHLREYISLCDYAIVMTIEKIGGIGQELNHELLIKANQIKQIRKIPVISDGGLRSHNAIDFKNANFDVAVGGSIINKVEKKENFVKYFDRLVKNV